MARIINITNHLEKELHDVEKIINKGRFKVIAFILLGFLMCFLIPIIGFLVGFVIWVAVVLPMMQRYKGITDEYLKLKSGLKGEKESLNIFSKLPDSYGIITDIEIEVDGKKSQLDTVIVGTNGVFIIETKNINGEIQGRETDDQIIQHKVGIKGGEYSKKMYNPIKQVSTHVYRLSQILRQNDLNIWVQGVVLFTNPEANICIDSNNIPVFSVRFDGKKELYEYIVNYDGKNSLTQTDVKKVEDIISKYIMK